MNDLLRRFSQEESGTELVEWVVVTIILTLAIYAILQAIGPDIRTLIASLASKLP